MGTLTSGNIKAGALGTGLIPASNTYVSSGTAVYDQIYYNSGGQEMETFDFSENGLQPGEAFVYEKSAAGKLQGYDGFCIVSDESDGSQKFIDLGPNKFKVAAQADVHHDSGGGKFKHNPTSIYFDGTGDYLQVPDHEDWDAVALGTTGWTYEAWIYVADVTDRHTLWHQYVDNDNYFLIVVDTNGGISAYSLANGGYIFGNKNGYNAGVGKTLVNNAWNHVAAVRDGNEWLVYTNGVPAPEGPEPQYGFGTFAANGSSIISSSPSNIVNADASNFLLPYK